MPRYFSYWIFPVIAGLVWLGMIMGMLIHWVVDTHRRVYPSESGDQTIAYISDVGAQELKPLFITGSVITTIFFDISFAADRWLRHKGRLVPNNTIGEKILSGLTIVFAIIGTAGLILLSIFDTWRYPRLHDIFLLLFIGGYVISAILICAEYQRLGKLHRSQRVLRISFWIKLVFSVLTILLAIGFISCSYTGRYNPAAILEWAIAFLFSLYVFSFFIDLYPAIYTKHGGLYQTNSWGEAHGAHDAEQNGYGSQRQMMENGIGNGNGNGYANDNEGAPVAGRGLALREEQIRGSNGHAGDVNGRWRQTEHF